MRVRITWRYLLAFFALTLLLGEAHEQAHITTGRIVCGGYGPRDFNAWRTSAECVRPHLALLATTTGPLFSYAVMWLGAWLLARGGSAARRAVGFSLVFGALPFARVFTALMGGGDEGVVLRRLLGGELSRESIRWVTVALVLACCAPPVVIAYRNMRNRFRALYVAGFCVLPLLILGVYVFMFLNGLLARGVWATPPIAGTPPLVVAHTLLMAAVLAFSGR